MGTCTQTIKAMSIQITDVETKVNGIMTYYRKLIKMDNGRLKVFITS